MSFDHKDKPLEKFSDIIDYALSLEEQEDKPIMRQILELIAVLRWIDGLDSSVYIQKQHCLGIIKNKTWEELERITRYATE